MQQQHHHRFRSPRMLLRANNTGSVQARGWSRWCALTPPSRSLNAHLHGSSAPTALGCHRSLSLPFFCDESCDDESCVCSCEQNLLSKINTKRAIISDQRWLWLWQFLAVFSSLQQQQVIQTYTPLKTNLP
jgi:hypothetical protein